VSDFKKALEYVLVNEGGYSDIPEDAGGATNLGITINEYSKWVGHPVSKEDMKRLTLDDVAPIYEKNYWLLPQCDKMNSTAVATCVFDMCVNFGPYAASKMAQSACNLLGSHLYVDGKIGPLSLAELNRHDPHAFVTTFEQLVEQRYQGIVANNPSQRTFLKGWMNRAKRLLTLV